MFRSVFRPLAWSILLVVYAGFTLLSCPTQPDYPDQPITLNVQQVDLHAVQLEISVPDSSNPRQFRLTRNDQVVTDGTLGASDTVIWDGGLSPRTTYTYQAMSLYDGHITNRTDPVQVTTLDTTSHQFTWAMDTLGIYPSDLHGVWGTDANNVYAVGLIFYSYDPYRFTGIVHWDGTQWTSMEYHEGDVNDIYGFGPDDIWAVGSYQVGYEGFALIAHWDGQQWTTWKHHEYGGLAAVWGTSSSNLYAVGANGLILHYDGQQWIPQESGTSLSLNDIFGLNSKHIYVTGKELSSGSGVLLRYNGKTWRTLTRGGYPQDSAMLYGIFRSVWASSSRKLYVVGALSYEGVPGNWMLSEIPYNAPGDNLVGLTAMNRVRGTTSSNVFICGDRNLMIHWNGNSWHLYHQFFDKTKNSSLKDIWTQNENIFVVGYEGGLSSAVIYRGTQ